MAYFQFYTQYFILYNFKEQSNPSKFNNYFSTPPPHSHHHTRIFPAHILPASLVLASHSLNTSTSAPLEHSFLSGFLSRRLSTQSVPTHVPAVVLFLLPTASLLP